MVANSLVKKIFGVLLVIAGLFFIGFIFVPKIMLWLCFLAVCGLGIKKSFVGTGDKLSNSNFAGFNSWHVVPRVSFVATLAVLISPIKGFQILGKWFVKKS